MADYATVAQIKAFVQPQDSTAALSDDYWEILATAASRLFDNQCEVEENFFQEADSASERTFTGNGTAYLKLPPFTQLDDADPVTIADDEYDVPDYTVIGSSLVVLERTKRTSFNGYSPETRFVGWRDAVQVTVSAKWGFAAIPADITFAVIQMALAMWKNSDPSFASIANVDGSLAQTAIPATAKAVIDKYREKYSQRCLFA